MSDMTEIEKAIDEFERATEDYIYSLENSSPQSHIDFRANDKQSKREYLLELIRKEVKDE